ncbi:hypothetical protein HHK36_002938 [Tetracentron sinense]|uniref:BZIP domain-containing protein n=1 Tax=Tetracentron sinense TaxID=13715 RepID=A0A834ZMX5_TETSI|nr:hypothetical protein HHK36_002938 [Tetracentron sinense]
MDDGELDFLNQEAFSSANMDDQLQSSCSMDSFFEELLKDTHACTHTHTCNPPGPDLSHTHTCFHVHTKILSAPTEDKTATDDTSESAEKGSKKRSLGNREAVRKYREKKKARAASLEDEVIRLKAINQQLLKRLQGQAALEAEIARLKCLLVDIRGRIEGEIGSFPYQKLTKNGHRTQNLANPNLSGAYVMNSCDLRCDDQIYCMYPRVEDKGEEGGGLNDQDFNTCEIGNVQCMGNPDLGLRELPGCGLGNVVPTVNSSSANKRKVFEKFVISYMNSELPHLQIDGMENWDVFPIPVITISYSGNSIGIWKVPITVMWVSFDLKNLLGSAQCENLGVGNHSPEMPCEVFGFNLQFSVMCRVRLLGHHL